MGIDARHPLYDAAIARWQRCRDCYDGEDAIKAGGEKYLPRPGGLSDSEYKSYKERALFYESVGRTIDGFVGSIARKDPTLEIPASLQPIVDEATADGLTLDELTKRLSVETILQGRGGLLVDFDDEKQRPYFVLYTAESITNWSDNEIILIETVYEEDPEDRFKKVAITQYRQLTLTDGVYQAQLWRRPASDSDRRDEWVPYGGPLIPRRRGGTLNAIPFFWLTPLGQTSRIEKPPLLGLVSVSVSHYRNSADLEHGRHFTGLPTLYVTGISDNDTPIRVGSMAAIVIADANAKVGYAEFTGQGLKSLETALQEKEHMMAVLGASVFSDGKKGVEAAETARIRTSGETSLLSGVVTAIEATLKSAMEFAAMWMHVSGAIEITLNREFIDTTMDGPTLTGLVQAFQAGALSLPQFLYNLQQGELLAPDTDLEEEQSIVEAENEKRQKDAMAMATSKSVSKKTKEA